jgi:hypothetical protein
MPLLDHFHPPLSKQRHWDSFHGAWAEAITRHLNEDLLPPRFVAEARVKIGSRVEIDVATLEQANGTVGAKDDGGVAVWAPPKPTVSAALDFADLDAIEITIVNDEEGPKIVSAIELVSPANKDRPSHRQAFAVKCASYLQEGVSVMIVDVVTERHGNLHADLLQLLKLTIASPVQASDDLYATAYRPMLGGEHSRIDLWAEALAIASPLPTLPLWLSQDLALPLDLDETYRAACAARRIELP